MKIAIVHLYLAAESGDPRMVFSLARSLLGLGHQVVIYTAEFDKKYFPSLHQGLDIRVVSSSTPLRLTTGAQGLFSRIRERLLQYRVFARAARDIEAAMDADFDLVDLHNDYSYQIGVRYKKRNPRARIIWIMHNPPFYHAAKRNPLVNILSQMNALIEGLKVKRFLDGIDSIVTLDEERKLMALSLGKSVKLLRIPVQFENFYQPAHHREIGSKKIILCGVGSLSRFRKFEDIISAGAVLQGRGYDVRIRLVCRDYWNERGYRAELLHLAESLKMTERVVFMFEGASEAELKNIQKESDVFVFPNVVNIWGMAAFEAMAAGLPLVVSSVTSVAEVLRDGVEAVFFEAGNPNDLADKVERLLQEGDYHQIALNGQKFVKENLSWENYAKQLVEID